MSVCVHMLGMIARLGAPLCFKIASASSARVLGENCVIIVRTII